MNIELAAAMTIELVEKEETTTMRHTNGKGLEHALWMLNGISDGYVQREKGHRWLGYAQALAVENNAATLDEMKQINRKAADEDRHND